MRYVKCSCSSEVLGVEYDEDIKSFDLFIFKHYNNNDRLSFRDRIRYMWKIFRTGQPYSDQMIINSDAKDLADLLEYLNGIVKNTEQNYVYDVLQFVARFDLYSKLYWAYELVGEIKFYFEIENSEFVNYVPLNGTGLYEINSSDLDKMKDSILSYIDLQKQSSNWAGVIAYIEERERVKD